MTPAAFAETVSVSDSVRVLPSFVAAGARNRLRAVALKGLWYHEPCSGDVFVDGTWWEITVARQCGRRPVVLPSSEEGGQRDLAGMDWRIPLWSGLYCSNDEWARLEE